MQRLRVALWLVLVFSWARVANAQVTEHGETPRDVAFVARSVASGATAPLRWSRSEWLALGGGVAGLAALSLLDGEARSFVRRQRGEATDAFARQVKPFGARGSAVVVGAFLGYGLITGHGTARDIGVEAVAASVLASALVVPALQASIGRSRPWHERGTHAFAAFSGRHSFPSGHATQAFVVASVIAAHAESRWLDGAAYSAAGLVAWSRMHHDAHHLSDVTAGALLGTVIGRWVARRGRHGGVTLTPSAGPGGLGAAVSF